MTASERSNRSAASRAENNPNWKGGQWINTEGRVFVRVPEDERHLHPTLRKDGYIQRYQYVWNTAHPDDPVTSGDVIHHKDEDKQNDALSNLEKITQSEHARLHGAGRQHSPEARERMSRSQLARRARERGE
jgi:hypothetical protein